MKSADKETVKYAKSKGIGVDLLPISAEDEKAASETQFASRPVSHDQVCLILTNFFTFSIAVMKESASNLHQYLGMRTDSRDEKN